MKSTKALTKFTNVDTGKPIYIDLAEVHAVDVYEREPDTNTSGANYTLIPAPSNYHVQQATRIYSKSGHCFFVLEHIAEVLALMEGRDPAPARVIYGKHKNT